MVATAGVQNSKVFHREIRNMFSGGAASATNSPLAFMERTSSATEELLSEQIRSNKKLARSVTLQTDLLKKLLKSGVGGGKQGIFTTLAEASLFKKIFNKVFLGAAAVFGFGASFTKDIFAWIKGGNKALGFGGKTLSKGMELLKRAGKPMISTFTQITSFLNKTGFMKTLVQLSSKLTKLSPLLKYAGIAVRGLGKLALPLTALMGALDGIDGFMNASKILGKGGEVGIYRRLQAAQSTILNGLLLGIPDYLTKKFLGGRTYAQMIDDVGLSFADNFKTFTLTFSKFLGTGVKRFKSEFTNAWENAKLSETFETLSEVIKENVLWLGIRLNKGIWSFLKDIDGYFDSTFQGVRDYIKKQDKRNRWFMGPNDKGEYPADSLAPLLAPGPKNKDLQNRRGRTVKQLLPVSSKPSVLTPVSGGSQSLSPVTSSTKLSPVNTSASISPVPSASTVVPLSPEAAKTKILGVEDAAATFQTTSGVTPPYLSGVYDDGINMFGDFGAEMVQVVAAGTAATIGVAKAGMTGTLGAVNSGMATIVEEHTASFSEVMLKKLPALMKQQMDKAFSKETFAALAGVLSGTDTAGNLAELFPSRAGSGDTSSGTTDSETVPGVTEPSVGPAALPSIAEAKGPGQRASRLDPVMKRLGLDKKLEEKRAARKTEAGGTNLSTEFVDPMTNPEVNDAIKKKYKGKHVPVSIRNNNPGAVSITGPIEGSFGASQPGFVGVTKRPANEGGYYAKYATPTHGVHASSQLLKRFGSKGINTTDAIVKKWSTDKRAWSTYSATLKKHLSDAGLNPDGPLDLNDPNVRAAILKGKSAHESGAGIPTYKDDVYKAGAQDELSPDVGAVDPTTTKAPEEAYKNVPAAQPGYSILKQNQKKLAGIRKRPLQPELARNIDKHILKTFGPGYTAEVYSGGQAKKGTRGPRTGTTRHDEGNAGDLIIKGPDGKMISQEEYARFGQGWIAEKQGGIGLQMRTGGIHVDQHKDRAPYWNYDGKGIPVRKPARQLIQKGLEGEKPEYKMTDEEAEAWLEGQGPITKQKEGSGEPLSAHPMFRALEKPLSKNAQLARRKPGFRSEAGKSSSVSTGVSSNRYGSFGAPNADADAFRTRAGMKEKLGEYGLADKLLGESSIQGLDKAVSPPSVTQEGQTPVVPPKAPTPATPQQHGKPPMQQNKPSPGNVDVQQAGMPSIETIPSLDELKMLSVNSEALS